MSKQRIVKDNFWTDPYIEDLDPIEKLMFLYLLTNPLCNILGIYEIRIKRIAYETGIDKDMVDKVFDRFVKDKKLIRVNDWVIITNFAKNQSINPSVQTGMQRIYNDLPDKVKQAVTGCTPLETYLTLLNLTLLNLKGEKTPTKKPVKKDFIELLEESLNDFKGKLPDNILKEEVQKFILYWTEKNPNGKKEKWEMQSTFDVKRRLASWLKNTEKWDKQKLSNKPQIIL